MSSIAMSVPIFSSWPCRAHGPDSGAIEAILTVFVCARPMRGAASALIAVASPAATLRRVKVLYIILSPLIRGSRHPRHPFLAQIRLDHARIADGIVGPALGYQAPVVEHGETV